jgi:hypothetical protein
MDDNAGGTTGHPREFWVNAVTGQVEEGRLSPAAVRMGPYPTREAAQHAFDTAAARNEEWDEADRRWNDDSWPRDT